MDSKEYQRQYQREYYRKHKETINQRAKEWKTKNPDKAKAIQQKWRDANKEKREETRRKWKGTLKGHLTTKLSHLKKQKRSRVLDFEITVDDLLALWESQNGCCAISKYPMRYPESSLFSVSVDRIDPSRGYTKDNIQLVCQGINFAKNKYSNEEMIEFWEYRDR